MRHIFEQEEGLGEAATFGKHVEESTLNVKIRGEIGVGLDGVKKVCS